MKAQLKVSLSLTLWFQDRNVTRIHSTNYFGKKFIFCIFYFIFYHPREHTAPVVCLTCALNNTLAISGGDDCSIIISNLQSGRVVSKFFYFLIYVPVR